MFKLKLGWWVYINQSSNQITDWPMDDCGYFVKSTGQSAMNDNNNPCMQQFHSLRHGGATFMYPGGVSSKSIGQQ